MSENLPKAYAIKFLMLKTKLQVWYPYINILEYHNVHYATYCQLVTCPFLLAVSATAKACSFSLNL